MKPSFFFNNLNFITALTLLTILRLLKILNITNKHTTLMKPSVKWEINVWVTADAVSGYCCNLQIYTGKEGNNVEKGLASRVVKDLMENYQGLGHHLHVDNFYTIQRSFRGWNTGMWDNKKQQKGFSCSGQR